MWFMLEPYIHKNCQNPKCWIANSDTSLVSHLGLEFILLATLEWCWNLVKLWSIVDALTVAVNYIGIYLVPLCPGIYHLQSSFVKYRKLYIFFSDAWMCSTGIKKMEILVCSFIYFIENWNRSEAVTQQWSLGHLLLNIRINRKQLHRWFWFFIL